MRVLGFFPVKNVVHRMVIIRNGKFRFSSQLIQFSLLLWDICSGCIETIQNFPFVKHCRLMICLLMFYRHSCNIKIVL